MIGGFMYYVADLLFYFFMMGVVMHLGDRFFGIALYRWWYNTSREAPMPESEEKGFMYNRPFARRHKIVLWISGIQSLYMLWFKGISVISEMFAWPLEAWTMLLGFSAGKYFYAFMKGEKTIVETMGSVRVPHIVTTVKDWCTNLIAKVTTTRGKAAHPEPLKPEPVTHSEPQSPQPHWRERLDALTKRGGSE